MIQGALDTWLPQKFVLQSSGLDFGAFISAYGLAEFLLVRHDTAVGVRAGLEQTSVLDAEEGGGNESADHWRSVTAVVEESSGVQSEATRTVAQIARRLATWEIFVVPLAKRLENGFPEKISIGRTKNNDIVLRHGTVSSFHGWFSRNINGELQVRDGGSKNGTTQNGGPVVGASRVRSGDTVRFGRVECMVCSAEALWSLLASSADDVAS